MSSEPGEDGHINRRKVTSTDIWVIATAVACGVLNAFVVLTGMDASFIIAFAVSWIAFGPVVTVWETIAMRPGCQTIAIAFFIGVSGFLANFCVLASLVDLR